MLGRFRLKDRKGSCAQGDRAEKRLDRANGAADADVGGRLRCPLMNRAR